MSSPNRYPALVILVCLLSVAGFWHAAERSAVHHVPVVENTQVILTFGPGDLPDWAQTPSSNQGTRNTPPPGEAATPVLPGPPSMPIPGVVFLVLAGGALACRCLYGTQNRRSRPQTGSATCRGTEDACPQINHS